MSVRRRSHKNLPPVEVDEPVGSDESNYFSPVRLVGVLSDGIHRIKRGFFDSDLLSFFSTKESKPVDSSSEKAEPSTSTSEETSSNDSDAEHQTEPLPFGNTLTTV